MADFKLEAIKCRSCGSGLVVELNDFITYCTSCGNGFEITESGLQPIEINFATAAIRGEGELVYKPFWFLKSRIEILERESSGGFFKNLFGGGNSSSGEIKFYIPAFYCHIDSLKSLATQFTLKNPVASPQKFNTKITGFSYGREDAMKLAEFLLISFEAEKNDTMKTFRYEINFDSYEILGIPFYKSADGHLTDAILGIKC